MFGSLQTDTTALINEAIQLSYFMRGAVSYEDMLRRTPGERQLMSTFIEKRLDGESKKMHPVY